MVTDVDEGKVARAVEEFGVDTVEPDDIYRQQVDVFAPYALGGVINDETLPQLTAKVVAGSANNVLAEERHGDELERRGIVYAVPPPMSAERIPASSPRARGARGRTRRGRPAAAPRDALTR